MEPVGTTGGNVNGVATVENRWRLLKKLNTELPGDAATPLLDAEPKNCKQGLTQRPAQATFKATSVTASNGQKQRKRLLSDGQAGEQTRFTHSHDGTPFRLGKAGKSDPCFTGEC